MEQLTISLRLDLSNEASRGAGWYLGAVIDGTPVFHPVPISSEAAHSLSGALQTALQSSDDELPQVTIPQLVTSGERLVRQALETQLRYAEEQAKKVALLRRKLGQIPPPRPEPVAPSPMVGTP